MAGEIVRYELDENVAVLHFDDGKANVIGLDSIAALHAGLDRASRMKPARSSCTAGPASSRRVSI